MTISSNCHMRLLGGWLATLACVASLLGCGSAKPSPAQVEDQRSQPVANQTVDEATATRMLKRAADLIKAKRFGVAQASINQVAGMYEAKFRDPGTVYYSARSQPEAQPGMPHNTAACLGQTKFNMKG